jgi:hypothetical protein
MRAPVSLLILLTLPAIGLFADAPATPRPKRPGPHVCDPYAERCPACSDCSKCKACSKENNRCSVKRAQLGMGPKS